MQELENSISTLSEHMSYYRHRKTDFFVNRKQDGYSFEHFGYLRPYWSSLAAELLETQLHENSRLRREGFDDRQLMEVDLRALCVDFKENIGRLALLIARAASDPMVQSRVLNLNLF